MTREEAYNRIDAIIARHEIDDDYVTITSMLDYDALRMARKALEQEPCEDAISRQAVLEYIDGSEAELAHWSEKELVCQDIKELPSVNPQEPSEDAVSRQGFDEIKELMTDINGDTVYAVRMSDIRQLPPVTPQPKMGHWILDETDNSITCDKCGCLIWANDISNGEAHYCTNCGAEMRGVE